jgi:multidrug efflux pump subunit AcrB
MHADPAHKNDFIGLFAQHPVAANLIMVVMLLSGVMALGSLNTQFFPSFDVEVVSVRVVWSGATPEDVERSIIVPLEQELRTVEGVDKMSSTSSQNVGAVLLEFPEGTDMGEATDRVQQSVNSVRNLPQEAEQPQVSHLSNYEPIAKMLIHGPSDMRELRMLARRFERELLARGVAKIDISGLPTEEIAIQIPMHELQALDMSLAQAGSRIADSSQDLPAGTVGKRDVGRQLRSMSQQRDVAGFQQLPLVTDKSGQLVRVMDVAQVERRPRPNQVAISYQGEPAVQLQASRSQTGDSLEAASVIQEWLAETRPLLPPNVHITVYDESWQLIKDRIMLLVKNGSGGLILVVLILFLFLNARVAWWVTLGIPISFMATLGIVWLAGGSINMISLFGLIMALGIIVDDAIVVGEDALSHYQSGEHSLQAAEGGARRMLAPVISSSLTTIAAFIPLMMISGIIGKILFDIPFVVICVILASLVEVFLVLPGHLRHSFQGMHHQKPGRLRQNLDNGFAAFRENIFRPLVTVAVRHRVATIASALGAMIFIAGLFAGGRLGFTFFPNVEGNIIYASASFVSGTPPQRVAAFIEEVEQALYETDRQLGGGLVRTASVSNGLGIFSDSAKGRASEQFATVTAELVASDARSVRNEEFLDSWKANFNEPAGLENITLTARRGGPPGRDLEVRLTGADSDTLKAAALDLIGSLRTITGVSGVEDDMPYGQQQLIYELTPVARGQGLTVAEVGRQLRDTLDGHLAQIFVEGEEEVEVRVMLPDEDRYRLATLEAMNLFLPSGSTMPLSSAVELKERRGFEVLRHNEGLLAVTIYADVDSSRNNANRIRQQLQDEIFPGLTGKYQVDWDYTGRAKDQDETMRDMKRGGLFAVAMIYVVLAWVFGSYGWPLVVMSIIPFGVIGAVVGHWLMGIDLTLLSMFGIFGLSGIVVNDSIILVMFFKQLKERGMETGETIVEAACQRLRAVLLTSLTTIAGLTPLLFETSLQAQFLIPMAVSISFGLAFATLLVLLLVPALLMVHERTRDRFAAWTTYSG